MTADLLHSRRGTALIVAAMAIVFLGLRVALLAARDPFFDELFTLWISQKSLAGIIDALRHDSGPPLYYFLVHALGVKSVFGARAISLVASCATLGVLLSARSFGPARFTAAALLAVYPPAVLFAIDARAYALCAFFVTIALVSLRSGRVLGAALALVAAAYSHYYGALFFPLLLWPWKDGGHPARPSPGFQPGDLSSPEAAGQDARPQAGWKPAILGAALAALLFLPGLWLAAHQPREAMGWLHESRWSFLKSLSFAGDYAYGLFQPAPMWLVIIAGVVLLLAIAGSLVGTGSFTALRSSGTIAIGRGTPDRGGRDARTPAAAPAQDDTHAHSVQRLAAAATIVPLAIAVVAGVYFPMRFESIVAVPLVLWIASAAGKWGSTARRIVVSALLLIGLATTYGGILDHAGRPADPYRAAAIWTGAHVRGETVVASGYCYLEAAMNGHPEAIAFPAEQGVHPGWRARPRGELRPPPVPFVWIGERAAPELSILRKSYTLQPLYANGGALVARVLLH